MGFRFYTPRLTVSGCNSVSVTHSAGHNPAWCVQGSCTTTCGTGDRMFYVNFYMYRQAANMYQWRYWNSGEYYDLTFNFNSVGDDANTDPDHIFVTASLVWENSRYYWTNEGMCSCYYPHYSCGGYSCYYYWDDCCSNDRYDRCTYSYECPQYCHTAYSCRYMNGWSYYVALSDSGYAKPTTNVAASVSTIFTSMRYDQEAELIITLDNLYTSFTSTMTSTTRSNNNQLIVSFTGN